MSSVRISSLARAQWVAVGAAVAVALGAGGLNLAAASVPNPSPVLTTITPCRLFDTRPAPVTVGPRSTPLGAGATFTASVRGTNGNCTVPANAVGVVMNVTIVNPTGAGFLTVWPSDQPQPLASSLNWLPGQGATPNQVTTALAAVAGSVSFFNSAGTVNVIADIIGYLTDHHHDDRYYTKAQIDAQAHIALADQRFSLMWVSAGAPKSAAIREDGSIRFTSDPGIVVTRVGTGHYCIQVNAPQEGAVGTLQDKGSTHGTIDVTMGIGSPCAAAPGAQISVQTWQIT